MLIQETHKRLYRWHSKGAYWTSIFLLILCVTAIPVVFNSELQQYVFSSALKEQSTRALSHDEIATLSISQLSLNESEFFVDVDENGLPSTLWWWEEATHKFHAFIPNASSKLQAVPEIEATTVIALAHYEFLIPDPYGEYFVGFIGLFTLVIVVIGVLLHVKWRKEKTQFRKKRSFRLWSSDLHKLLGFWLLPYHLLVTYTGTILGLGGLLLIMSAMSSFEGDQEAAVAAVLGEEPTYAANECDMLSIDDLLTKAEVHWNKKYGRNKLSSYDIHYYQDCHAVLGINSKIPGYLLLSNRLSYSLVDGSLQQEIDWLDASVGDRWYALLGPLHYGHFAGYFGRWFYVISALVLVGLIITGLLLWVDKQQSQPLDNKIEYFYQHPLLKLSVAVTIAIAFTTYNMLIIAKGLPSVFDTYSATGLYLTSFFIATLIVYFFTGYLVTYLYTLVLLSIGLISLDFTYSNNPINGVNLSLAVFAIAYIAIGRKLQKHKTC